MKIKMYRNIDKKFEDLGFTKIKDDIYGASYTRKIPDFNFIHRIDIIRKDSGRHLISSYEKDLFKGHSFNNQVGITYDELKLCMKKYRELKRKYKWK